MYLLILFIVIVAEWIHFHWQRSTAAELPDLSCTKNKSLQWCLTDTSTATDGPGDATLSHQPAGLNSADDSAAQRNTFNLFYFLRGLIAQLIARINKCIKKNNLPNELLRTFPVSVWWHKVTPSENFIAQFVTFTTQVCNSIEYL